METVGSLKHVRNRYGKINRSLRKSGLLLSKRLFFKHEVDDSRVDCFPNKICIMDEEVVLLESGS